MGEPPQALSRPPSCAPWACPPLSLHTPSHQTQLQRTRDHCPQPHIPALGWGHPPPTPRPSRIPRPASTVTPPAPDPSQPVSPGLSPPPHPTARSKEEEGYSWGRQGQGPQKAENGPPAPPVSAPFHIPGPPTEGTFTPPSALPALGPPNVRVPPRPPITITQHSTTTPSHSYSTPHPPPQGGTLTTRKAKAAKCH